MTAKGATVNQTVGTYSDKDAGFRDVSVSISESDLTASAGTLLSNYSFPTLVFGVGTITPARLGGHIYAEIINNPTKTYDGTTVAYLTASNFNLTGFVAGEGATVTQTVGTYGNKNAGVQPVMATLTAGDFVANSGTNLSNYILPTQAYGTGTIQRALIAASISGDPTKVYNGTRTAELTAANYAFSGFASGEGVTVANGLDVRYDHKDAGARTITVNFAATSLVANNNTLLLNYILPTTATGTGTITRAPVTVVGAVANNRVYDATTLATLNLGNARLYGLIDGDVISLDTSGVIATFGSADAANGKGVTASGFDIGGQDVHNYQLFQPTGLSANITRKALTLSQITALNRAYDGTTNAALNTASGILNGVIGTDAVSVNTAGISGTFADKNVNTGIGVTLSGLGLSGAQAGNYTIASSVTDALIGQITPAALTVSGVVVNNKVYDRLRTATFSSYGTLSGLLGSDDVILDPGAVTGQFNSNANVANNKGVTVSGYSISGSDMGNYTFTQPTGVTANITPKTLTVASVQKTYNGNRANNGATYRLAGVISSDTVTMSATNNASAFGDKNVAGQWNGLSVDNGISINLTGVTLSGAQSGNYTIASTVTNEAIGIITPKNLTAAIINNPTKTYDRTNTATLTSANFTLSGFITGEGASVIQTTGTYNSVNAGSRTVTATLAPGDFTANGGTLLSNYNLPTTATGAGTINKATVTISGLTANNKIYDTTTSATLSGTATLNGIVSGDTITLNASGATAVFASPDAGTGITVTATGFALSDSTNYLLTQPTGLSANIATANLTLTRVERVYNAGTGLAGSTYTLAGVIGGDDVGVNTSGITGNFANKNVNTGISLSLTGLALSGAHANNYVINSTVTDAQIGVITPATLTLSGIAALSKIYDGSTNLMLDNSGLTLNGRLGTDDLELSALGATAAFGTANVGTYTINASGYSLGGQDAGNYILTQPTGLSASITPKALTAAIIGTPTKTYNGNTNAALTNANFAMSGFVTGEGASVTQTTGTYASADAGSRNVTANLASGDFSANSGTLLSNYTLPTTATGAGLINQAVLTAAIINTPTKTYNGNNTAALTNANFALSGFISGEGASVTQTTGTYDSVNAGNRNVSAILASGDFTANSGTLLSNYVLPTDATGAGLINQAILTAAIIGTPTKTYNGNADAALTDANFTLSGFVTGEGASVTQTTGTYDSANAGARGVSTTVSDADFRTDGSTLMSNYDLPASITSTGQIGRKNLSAALVNVSKPYDGTTDAPLTGSNFVFEGFITGEGATSIQTSGQFAGSVVGTHDVSATLSPSDLIADTGTLLDNYVLPTRAEGQGVISPTTMDIASITARAWG
ncbi:beta strand repeat-containing protein [Asticcacaulis tiandongensis]|uniref:beta strand repeat-containing protein n=1 Tax=Asticcacaulis tiandongensis TaxID=2565365 RepID=UPI00112E409A|nr:YDG domain-containing protein [Asticcacaulis tiandongensis]